MLLTVGLDFRDDVKTGRIERIVTETEATMKPDFPEVRKVFVEVKGASGHKRATSRE